MSRDNAERTRDIRTGPSKYRQTNLYVCRQKNGKEEDSCMSKLVVFVNGGENLSSSR